jgi:hypothetical protein
MMTYTKKGRVKRSPSEVSGEVLPEEARTILQKEISRKGLAQIAQDVDISALTLTKAAGGYPVGAGTLYKITARILDEAEGADGGKDDEEDGN